MQLGAAAGFLIGRTGKQRKVKECEGKPAKSCADSKIETKQASSNLRGKNAVVTGSTSGIGLAIARSLAQQGVNVVVHGSRDRQKDDAVDQLQSEFPHVRFVYCKADLSQLPAAAESLINTCVKELGSIDILINNAGIQHVSPIESFPTEQWDRLIAVNLSSAFHTMRCAIPAMKKNAGRWGRIINISSVHGVVASINKAAYIASKHGLNGLSKVAALELAADTEITVNSICPGWVHTPLVQAQIDTNAARDKIPVEQAQVELLSKKQPKPRFARTEDIGAYVVFLCSDAASNVTGAQQLIDGAWSVQ